jgi:hexosaminidase
LLAQKTDQVVNLTTALLQQRLVGQPLAPNARQAIAKQLLNAAQIEQEIIIALVFSAEKILDSVSIP